MKIEKFLKENKNKIKRITITTKYASFSIGEYKKSEIIKDIEFSGSEELKKGGLLTVWYNNTCMFLDLPEEILDKELEKIEHADDFHKGYIEENYNVGIEELKISFKIGTDKKI